MRDIPADQRDILMSLIDEPDSFIVAAWNDETQVNDVLSFGFKFLIELLDVQLDVVAQREDAESIQIDVAPAEAFRLFTISTQKEHILAGGITPRELYRLLVALTAQFPQSNRIYVIWGDIGYAWLRTDLPEEDAIIHMLSHDDGVRDVLGLREYDHSQW